jgi:hypothetical protein
MNLYAVNHITLRTPSIESLLFDCQQCDRRNSFLATCYACYQVTWRAQTLHIHCSHSPSTSLGTSAGRPCSSVPLWLCQVYSCRSTKIQLVGRVTDLRPRWYVCAILLRLLVLDQSMNSPGLSYAVSTRRSKILASQQKTGLWRTLSVLEGRNWNLWLAYAHVACEEEAYVKKRFGKPEVVMPS